MSKTDQNQAHRLDEQIRRALEPDAGAVQRAVAAALSADAEPRQPRRSLRLVMVSVMMIVIGAAIVLQRSRQLVTPGTEATAPVLIVVKAERPPVYRISNIGDVITITKPNGQVQAVISVPISAPITGPGGTS